MSILEKTITHINQQEENAYRLKLTYLELVIYYTRNDKSIPFFLLISLR